MNIALAVWNERLSPVFDASRIVRIVHLVAGQVEGESLELDLSRAPPAQRVSLLRNAEAKVLICGAISCPLAEMVQAAEIRLIPFVTGKADEVLAAFLRGELPSPDFILPGCGRRRRLRRKTGRGRCRD